MQDFLHANEAGSRRLFQYPLAHLDGVFEEADRRLHDCSPFLELRSERTHINCIDPIESFCRETLVWMLVLVSGKHEFALPSWLMIIGLRSLHGLSFLNSELVA